VRQYGKVLARLARFVGAQAAAAEVDSGTLEEWRDALGNEGVSPNTVNVYLRQAGTFFNWLADEGVVDESPTLAVKYVKQRNREATPPVFDAVQVKALVSAAASGLSGKSDFESIRDEAVLSFMADTGVRATECIGILSDNLNLPARQCFVHGEVTKGRYGRTVTFGFETAKLLGRYSGSARTTATRSFRSCGLDAPGRCRTRASTSSSAATDEGPASSVHGRTCFATRGLTT